MSCARPLKTASMRLFSSIEPITSPITTGGSAVSTGIWEMSNFFIVSIVWRTVSLGCTCTSPASSGSLVPIRSATVASSPADRKPYDRIHRSLKILPRYPRPPSGSRITITSSGPSSRAALRPDATARPLEPPTSSPSSRAIRRV